MSDKNGYAELTRKSLPLVCTLGDRIIGMAFLVPNGNPTDIYQKDWCYIRMVGVHPEYSGRGIARTLTTLCIGKAKEMNETTIALHTSEFMHAARHIYESLGFTVLKEIPRRYGMRYWLYTLTL